MKLTYKFLKKLKKEINFSLTFISDDNMFVSHIEVEIYINDIIKNWYIRITNKNIYEYEKWQTDRIHIDTKKMDFGNGNIINDDKSDTSKIKHKIKTKYHRRLRYWNNAIWN